MYIYSEVAPLTIPEIFQRVSQEEIMSLVVGYLPQTNRYVTSPFRTDKVPGCWFKWYEGKLWFIDFADRKVQRDCFNMLQDYFRISFLDCLILINNTFKLGLGSPSPSPVLYPLISTISEEEKEEKKRNEITFKIKSFDNRDALYWKKLWISRENLIEDDVFSLVWYKYYSNRLQMQVVIRPDNECYALGGFDQNKVKVYTPFSRNKRLKWITNCTANDIGGLSKLPLHGRTLVISKSYKDYRVLKNQGLNCIWLQNEGMFPDHDILFNLCCRFDEIIVFYDNDSVGIEAANKLVGILNSIFPNKANSIHLPTKYLSNSIKDPSDLVSTEGLSSLEDFLGKNNLNGINA